MSIIKEFKEFAVKGNLIDMSVAFVMGAAFGKVVSGFIDGLMMPLVGKITAGVDFKSLKYILTEAKYDETGKIILAETAIKYGEFITILIDFLFIAFFMFLLIKTINKLKRKEESVSPPIIKHSPEEILLIEIRDILKNK